MVNGTSLQRTSDFPLKIQHSILQLPRISLDAIPTESQGCAVLKK